MQSLRALLGLVVLALIVSVSHGQRCQTLPPWSVGGASPMVEARGSVTVVALLKASCSYCREQAMDLNILRLRLAADYGYNINMFVINSYHYQSTQMVNSLIDAVPFPVYQDTWQLKLWNDIFQGHKDDFFVFDRCGKMTYHIQFPESYMGYSHTQLAVTNTVENNICNCSLHSQPTIDIHDTMMGDAPAVQEHGASQSISYGSSGCAVGDSLCNMLKRRRREIRRENTGEQ